MKLVIPPPIWGLIGAGAMYGVARAVPDVSFYFSGQEFLAYGVMGIGVLIDLSALFFFWQGKTTIDPRFPHKSRFLVLGGPYRVSRNPMYLGLALLLFGVAIYLGNPLNSAVLIIFILIITKLQIIPEEEALREKFGKAYENYCLQVRRWL